MKNIYGKEDAIHDSIGWKGYTEQRKHLLEIYHRVSSKANRPLNFLELFWIAWACATPAEQRILEQGLKMLPYQSVKKERVGRPNDLYLRTFGSFAMWYFGIGVNGDKRGYKTRLETLYKSNKELHAAIFVNAMKKMAEQGFEHLKEEVFRHFDADTLIKQLGFKTVEDLKEAFSIRASQKRTSWTNTGLKNEDGTPVKGIW